MILDKENREFIKNPALEDTPKECCGFLYLDEDTGLVKTKKARNIAKEKNISFSVGLFLLPQGRAPPVFA